MLTMKKCIKVWMAFSVIAMLYAFITMRPVIRGQLIHAIHALERAERMEVHVLENWPRLQENFTFYGETGAGEDGQYTPDELRSIIPFRVICSYELEDGYHETFVEPLTADNFLQWLK